MIAAFPTLLEAAQATATKGGAMVVNVGSDGKMRRMLDDSQGKVMSFVTSVLEFDDHLYMGSLVNNFVGKLRLKWSSMFLDHEEEQSLLRGDAQLKH